MKHLMVEAA